MATTTKKRMSNLLLGNKKRSQSAVMFICLAAFVVFGVVALLRQRGIAVNTKQQVLDCQVQGVVAHTHNESCYDEDGKLVCTLPERELHVHDDSCYTEESTLVCGLEESEGHKHTEACYDAEGNLTCGLEESEGHSHSDACYEVTRVLTCGKEEVTEEHVHGPGCFREPDASESEMPAQTFSHLFKDADEKVVLGVDVTAPEGALPEGAKMKAEWIEEGKVDRELVQAALDDQAAKENEPAGKLLDLQAFAITFEDATGAEIKPASDVTVTLTSALVNNDESHAVVGVETDAEAKAKAELEGRKEYEIAAGAVEVLDEEALEERELTLAKDQLAFEGRGFTQYVLATSSREMKMVSEGETSRVIVEAPAEAGIPQGSTVQVMEIGQDTVEYEAYEASALDAMSARDAELARFFDIKILDPKGEEVQPQAPVSVKIKLEDAPVDGEQPAVVHFDESAGEPAPEVIPAEAVNLTTKFEAESFSVYGVVYTVDFHWEVDGQAYEFSLPGGGFISLEHLVQLLGVAGFDGVAGGDAIDLEDGASVNGIPISGMTKSFVADVASVQFSNPNLVDISKVEADTTVGQIRQNRGLVAQYSAGLTEEQIDAIDAQVVESGDWALISVQPFTSEESLTVTMSSGEQFVVRVTDAQITETVISDTGETWEVTVTYGPEAQIPEGAELRVTEILPEDDQYYDLYEQSAKVASNDAVDHGVDHPVVSGSRLFDIKIRNGKESVEPAAPVQVNIRLLDATEEADYVAVVHFAKNGPEAMAAEEVPLERSEAAHEVQFEAESFSVYTVQTLTSLDNYLNDAKYALVSERGTGITSADGKNTVSNFAMISSMRGDTLSGKGVFRDTSVTPNTVGGDVTEWGFESAGNNQYRIFMMDGESKRYVTASGSNLVLSDTATNDGLFTVNISNNKIRFSFNGQYITSTGNNPSQFTLTGSTGNDSLFNLCEVDPDYEEKTAKKVSAADWKAAEGHAGRWDENATVVIYRRVEHADGSESLYALATDGSLIPVYDGGDSIYYHCPEDKNVNWHVVLGASGYYISSVVPDGSGGSTVYLAPSVTNGTWSSDSPLGLTLGGMGSSYGTTIENWDQAAYAYAGLHIDATNATTLAQGVAPGSGDTSDTFLFAVVDTLISDGTLHTVDTVDSTSKGITMKIFNYGGDTYNYGYRNSSMQEVMGDAMLSDWDNRKSHVTRTVEGKLGSDGFPVSLSNGNSYAPLFTLSDENPGSIAESGGDANNLFLQSYYDENGMFRYSSMENFAHYNEDGNFTVYREAGTPNIPTENDHYYYYHGHFMPYNTLDTSVSVSRIVDQYGSTTDKEMGRSFENVYGLSETPDYYVGMSLEAKFVQPSGGTLENGDPVVYRFTGDDDLLVYIDGILVLDVGGIHEPLTGSINFETGVVTQPNFYGEGEGWKTHETTLYEIFRSAYNNGLITPEDWTKLKWADADGDGDYDTFADHTTHNFNMFYLERGAGASNLDVQFNLQVVKKGELTVRKNLPDGVKPEFVSQTYKFKAYFIDETEPDPANKKKPLYPEATKHDGTVVCSKVIYADLVNEIGQPVEKNVPFAADHSFTLRAGEAAVFSMANEEIVYDVYEVDVDGNLIQQVDVNGASTQIDSQAGPNEVSAGEDSIEDRSEVNVTNHPITQDLRVTKHITNDSLSNWKDDNPVFEFRVYLEQFVTDENGDIIYETDPTSGRKAKTKLVPYARSPYYLVKIPAGQEDNEAAWEYYTLTGENNAPVLQPHGTVCSITGRSGTINSIPPEYTIIIPDLAVGTHFYVEERRVTIPSGYEFDHEVLKSDTYDESTLVIDGDHIDQIMTIDSYSNDESHYFDADSVGRIKSGKDAEFDVWNRKPSIEIPVEKIWADDGAAGRPDDVTLALIRYKPQTKYVPEQGKGAIIIEHVADYGGDYDSTELPSGFVATYAIEKLNTTSGEHEVVATGTSGPFDVDPGTYRISTVVNNRGNEPANYVYNKTDSVPVEVQENQSTIATVTSEYKYEQGGRIVITHNANYEGGSLEDRHDLPANLEVTYTIKDADTNRIVHRNVEAGTYDVPAGTYTATANVTDPDEPENYVYQSTTTAEGVVVASGGTGNAELTSSYVYVAPKTYGYITINHVSSGLDASPALPSGMQVVSYRIEGPTTINNAQLEQEYRVEAGTYTVKANINYAPEVDGSVYVGTANEERVVGTNGHETVQLTSEYARHGQIVITHSYAGLPEGTTPSNFGVQYSIVNASGDTVRSHVSAGTYAVPGGNYTVLAHVNSEGTAPEGYFYMGTAESVSVTVPSDGAATADIVSTYGANGSITIVHKSEGLAGSPDELPSNFNVKYTILDADGNPVQGYESVDAGGTYTVAPGTYTVRTKINYQEVPLGYTYTDNPDTSDVDEGTPDVSVTIESAQNETATVVSHYDPPTYLTYRLTGTWADGVVPTNGSVTVPIMNDRSQPVGSFTLNPENNWTGEVSLVSGGGYGTYKLDTNNVTKTGVKSFDLVTTTLPDSAAGDFTYTATATPTTAKVYLCIDYSANANGSFVEVAKGSYVKLVYSNASIDHGDYTEQITPSWDLRPWMGSYSENPISGVGGPAPGSDGVLVQIPDAYDEYVILINTAPANAQYLNASLERVASLSAVSPMQSSSKSNVSTSSAKSNVALSLRTQLMTGTATVLPTTSMQSQAATGASTSDEASAQKAAKLATPARRGTPSASTVDPTSVTIPESVTDAITTTNTSLVNASEGYEYVLDTTFGKQVTLSVPWDYTFDDLEELGEGGYPYYYALVEMEVPENYEVSYSSNNPVSARAIRENMDARAEAEAAGEDLPDLLELSATNTKVVGSLEVTKTIQVNGGPNEQSAFPQGTYSYPVLITTVIDGTTYYVQDTDGTLATAAPEDPLTVTAGAVGEAGTPLVINNLPFGTYSVSEIQPDSVEVPGYSFVVRETGPGGNVHFESITSGEGTIATYQTPGSVSLVNYYMKGASWTPEVDKLLNGISYTADAEGYSGYTFTLAEPTDQNTIHGHDASHHTMTATTGTDGKAVFEKIDYRNNAVPNGRESKDFYYTITENRPEAAQQEPYIADSVQYDTKTIYVKVTVSKSGTGNNRVMDAQAHYYSDSEYTQPLSSVAFDNTELGTLTVTKKVTGDYTATSDDLFPFTVMKGDQYVTATVSGTTYTYAGLSDTNPGYTVKDRQTLTFVNIPVGTYVVTEGQVSEDGYVIVTTYKVDATPADNGTAVVQKATTTTVEITNDYTVNSAELDIIKLDANGMTTPLEGATFTITPIDETVATVSETGEAVTATTTGKDNVETGADGKATFSDLTNGYYIIKETKVPDGYIQTDGGYFFIRVNAGVVKLVERDGTGWKVRENTDKLILTAASDSEPASIKVGNTPGAALPYTGGPGTTAVYALGLAMFAAAGLLLIKQRA